MTAAAAQAEESRRLDGTDPSAPPATGREASHQELAGTAFASYFREYYPKLIRYALYVGLDRDTAQDAAQQAFEVLYRRQEAIDPENVQPYLYKVLQHEAIRVGRSSQRMTPVPDLWLAAQPELESSYPDAQSIEERTLVLDALR